MNNKQKRSFCIRMSKVFFSKRGFLKMNGLFERGLFYLCCGMGGAHLYNRSIVKCNIKILQEEIQNAKNDAYLTKKLKETLLKQRLYEGRLLYLLPPPHFNIYLLMTSNDNLK